MIINDISSGQIRHHLIGMSPDPFWSASGESDFPFGNDWASWSTGLSSMMWLTTHRQSNPTVERLRREISGFESGYHDGWDGPGTRGPNHEAIRAIRLALDAIPSGIVLPKTMLSRNGDIGLYWDFAQDGYADLSADEQGHLSFFSRDARGVEQFDDVPPIVLSAQWYWSRVGRLSKPGNLAA